MPLKDENEKKEKVVQQNVKSEEKSEKETISDIKVISEEKSDKKPKSENKLVDDSESSEKKVKSFKKKIGRQMEDGLNQLEKLYKFMNKFKQQSRKKTGNNLPWTHSLMYSPYGCFNIPEDSYPKFLRLYENALVAGFRMHVTENHKEFGPIVIDLDFVQPKDCPERKYTNTTIVNIVKLYNQVIRKYLNTTDSEMVAYVLEKKKPTLRKGEYHDGIHIVYPYICTKPSLQMLMRKEFLKLVEEHRIFKKIPLINDLDSVFDKNVIYHTGWAMYGSTKTPNDYPYYVTHIYNSVCNYYDIASYHEKGVYDQKMLTYKIYDTLVPGENIHNREYIRHFIEVLSCRRFYSLNQMTPLAEHLDPQDVDLAINKMRDKMMEETNEKENVAKLMGNDINFIKAVSEEKLVEAKNLVKLFSRERASWYYSWMQVGRCLHNIDYRLLDDWIEFSKKTTRNNFKKGECERLWKKMKPSNYTMATLHYFASQDNPEKYLELKKQKLDKLLADGLQISHNAVAKLLMEKYKFRFKCASIKHHCWYEFVNHRWQKIENGYTLRKLISDDLTIEYGKWQSYLYELSRNKQGYDKEQVLSQATKIAKLITNLNNASFKQNVMHECEDIAYDPNFLKNLDENIYLICFENGVYDLEANVFRDGCPDDYISLCTGYKYVPYDKNDQCSKEIKDFFKKIQPNKEMRSYLKMLLSTCLAGSVKEESFYVFTGSGANGKSKLMELMKYTMGDLFKPMDIMVLVGKRAASNSATPELADKKGIRICPFDEPKATDEINTGFMKIFTGGDLIMARALFSEPIYFKPQFKPFLLCNHLPNIKSDDDGTWRRLKVIPFLSKFVMPSEATRKMRKHGLPENHFWADNNLSEKLPEWKEMFMGMLIKYYQKYRTQGLVHPKLVTKHTAEYRKRCDVYQDFIGDFLEKTGNPKDTIPIIKLHEGMRSWYRANYEGKCPNTKDLRSYMLHRMPTYSPKTDTLTGYKIKGSDNDDMLDELTTLSK